MTTARLIAVLSGLLAPALAVFAWDAQAMLDVLPAAALVQSPSATPGRWVQTETTEMTAQASLSHTQPIVEGLSLSGTVWGMADTLPSQSPLSTPSAKIDLQSRLLELKLVWEAIPGTLIWDVGKEVIHPSSGFFRTPLNVISHGAFGNTASLTGSAVGAWEEGWVGTDLTLLVGGFTISNFFSPRLHWSDGVDSVLHYVSARQDDYQNLTRVDVRLGNVDMRLLGLLSTGGPESDDPELHFTAGAGLDTNIGDSVTMRGEITAASSRNRTVVTDSQGLSTATQAVTWAPRALAGFTWTSQDQLSVMAEYYYNGLGFIGNEYAQLIDYSQELRNNPNPSAPDALDQFGAFSAARHYGFLRVSGKIDDALSAAGWTAVNLQDLSGLSAVTLTLTRDRWAVNASFMDAWGATDTEAGLSPLLWKVDLEVSLFL